MKRSLLSQFAVSVLLLVGSTMAWGGDTSMLRPPAGSKVAIVVFEDLECPACAGIAPQLHDAAKAYNIPLVQYDFPWPKHPWSYEAAVNARFFDTKSKQVGDEYRLYIFRNQSYITRQNLRGYTERFAEQQKVVLPFLMDPTGELAAKVEADRRLGERIPIVQTPTVYIVSNTTHGTPFVEVADRTQLHQLIEQMIKQASETAQAHKTARTQKTSHSQ
jgi:protein-disulfide isomerase